MAAASVMFSLGATANPPGVPVGDPPLSCTTVSSNGSGRNYSVEAILGANGEFPAQVQCNGGTCSDYGYRVTSLSGVTISQSLFAVSADQDLYSTDPSSFVADLGAGDSTTGFLKYTRHEYPIRFNSNDSVFYAHIYIKGSSAPRVGTAYIRGGKTDESCLIAGPGVAGNPFVQQAVTKQVVAAGGKCQVTLHYNSKNEVVNITDLVSLTSTPCVLGPPPVAQQGKKAKLATFGPNGEPLPVQDGLDGKNGITFGTGTTTVYLPTGWAICTAYPCPGPTTYVWY
ncbi:MAG TPA: hypothetical protein DIC36_06275 [Gammaproteobacteria bacterium]|nr:hypothetical protein [Gammaproteobacteria bacterium]